MGVPGVVKKIPFLSKEGDHWVDTDKMVFCPKCGSENTKLRSFSFSPARYICLDCKYRFFRGGK
jgi:hypothetical protein